MASPSNGCESEIKSVPGQHESSSAGFLPWEKDLEMISKFLDRKDSLKQSHHQYIKQHPELRAILTDFMNALMIQKPDDVYKFAHDFFAPFSPNIPTPPSHHCHTIVTTDS